jgi:hypothetical protein
VSASLLWLKIQSKLLTQKSCLYSSPKHWGARNNINATSFSFNRRVKVQVAQQLSKPEEARPSAPTNQLAFNDDILQKTDTLVLSRGISTSFVPSFLRTSTAVEPPLALDDAGARLADMDVDSDLPSSINGSLYRSPPPHFASPPPSKRRKTGVLLSHLQKLRSEILGDTIRFQSGEYPYREKKSMFDMNDPRSRAKSYMDITILGDASSFGLDTICSKQVIVFAHVHDHIELTQGIDAARAPSDCLVWLILNNEPSRNHKPQKGSAVRLYNAVSITVPGLIQWVVTCTELGEVYPADVLGELAPTASDIAHILSLKQPAHFE